MASTPTTTKAGTSQQTGKTSNAAPADETKRQKFVRLAKVRVAKALDAVKVIGNLTGSNYDHTPADWEKINTAITAELAKVMKKASDPAAPKTTSSFEL